MNESEFLKETEERLKWCRHLENHFHKAADSLPGYVLIRRNIRGKHRYYYKKPDSDRQYYISTKNIALLRQLHQKRVAAHVLSPLRNNIRLLYFVLKEYRDISNAYDAYFPDELNVPASSEKRNTDLYAQTASDAAGHPEDLRHLTSFGLRVRSKSEAILAELLYSMHIPFTYEKPLEYSGVPKAPVRTFGNHLSGLRKSYECMRRSRCPEDATLPDSCCQFFKVIRSFPDSNHTPLS